MEGQKYTDFLEVILILAKKSNGRGLSTTWKSIDSETTGTCTLFSHMDPRNSIKRMVRATKVRTFWQIIIFYEKIPEGWIFGTIKYVYVINFITHQLRIFEKFFWVM